MAVSHPVRVRLIALAGLVALASAAAWWWRRPETPPSAPPPAAAAPTPADAGPPLFADWLAFESPEVRAQPAAADRYVDAILGHQVFRIPPRNLPPVLGRELLRPDDKLLLASGRRLWTRELEHQPGLAGEICYAHSTYCLRRLVDVTFAIDGAPAVVYEGQYWIERYPSHTVVHYVFPALAISEHKLITWDDRIAVVYTAESRDQQPHVLSIEAIVARPPVPGAREPGAFPQLAAGEFQGTPLYLYVDAPEFTRLEAQTVHLRRELAVPAHGETPAAALAVRFDTVARAQPATPLPSMAEYVRDYHRWFAEHVPYFDASDFGFKKMWYYRWWVTRFSMVEMATPDLQGYAFYEGKLGFDNAIGFAVPLQIKELTWLRDPAFAIAQLDNSYRNRHANGAVVDPPGSPYWNETYSHWIAAAAAEFHRVHPLPPDVLARLLPGMVADVRAWLSAYDADGDALPERDRPRVTGYDLDILSYWFFAGTRLDAEVEPPALERVDFASFVYANAVGAAELAEAAGDLPLAAALRADAARVRAATLARLWDDDSRFFYPQRAADDARVPIRELHGFFPFTTGLAPNEPRYTAALAALIDPQDFWARYPPVITSLQHYRTWTWEMDGLTRNIAPHPISMGARTLLQAVKHYDGHPLTARHFMELMRRYNDLIYPGVMPNDPYWRPNAHEYYSQWEPFAQTARPKPSDISHDFHSMYLALVVEGVVGLTPRADDRIELQPLARDWQYFALHRLRYRGRDLTIVWDEPDGAVRYTGFPEGFSLALDGRIVFTEPALAHVVYDPATGAVERPATGSQR